MLHSFSNPLDNWIWGRRSLGAGTDAPHRRRLLHLFGWHSSYYKYGPETATCLTWDEIKAGKEKPPIEHLGYYCRICEKELPYPSPDLTRG